MAALSIEIEKARRRTATRENREAHKRAALRLEEVFKASGMADELDKRDSSRNLKVETAFAVAFQAVDREHERDAITSAFMAWEEDEKGERRDRHEVVADLSTQMIRNNGVWIEGDPVPDEWLNDGCGPTGRAA